MTIARGRYRQPSCWALAACLLSGTFTSAQGQPVQSPSTAARPAVESTSSLARIGPDLNLLVGKSTLLRLEDPIDRISIGNPSITDVTLLSKREIYFLGKVMGSTNVMLWSNAGQATVIDVTVNFDVTPLQNELKVLLPAEKDITVVSTAGSIVLRGTVSDAVKVDQAVAITEAWRARLTRDLVLPVQAGQGSTTVQVGSGGGAVAATVAAAGPKIINMLRVRDPQQVMLEVKIAEVSKTVLERLGVTLAQQGTRAGSTITFSSLSNFAGQLLGQAAITRGNFFDRLVIDAQKDDGLVKTLAEPNIMAISGQEASFLAGGKIFIPVSRANDLTGAVTITLEEKEFGVGLKFKPTVLEGGRINLKVAPEVSELNAQGNPFTTIGGVTSVIPSFTVRRAETTLQLNDGQSFMIAGLVKNDVAASVNRIPGLGELPILGALFRSSEFQKDKTELMFVITPRLVKPLPPDYALPTDAFVEPSRAEFFLGGKMEGTPPPAPSKSDPATQGGFEKK
jgi:pilus assembly protein CpaC